MMMNVATKVGAKIESINGSSRADHAMVPGIISRKRQSGWRRIRPSVWIIADSGVSHAMIFGAEVSALVDVILCTTIGLHQDIF